MPRPICRNCAVEMRCSKNELVVNDPQVGSSPSTYWRGDAYKCPKCEAEIVTGFGVGYLDAKGEETEEFSMAERR